VCAVNGFSPRSCFDHERIAPYLQIDPPPWVLVMADGDKPRHEPPICPRCNTSDRVKPLTMSDMIGGVRYWWCDSCGNVWGTRERKDAR
jgi:hypothetical protein